MWEVLLEMLGEVVQKIVQAPHERRVKQYLNEATQESVLKDLQESLKSRSSCVKDLGATFDACSYGSGQKYWNDESLRKHIESSHPGLIPSKASLQLLWRCFHFYAFYPFPRHATNGMVDYDAFQRAVTLLVARGTDLLGMVDNEGFHWRCDESYIPQANLQRTIRSIRSTERIDEKSPEFVAKFDPAVDDTMDVLKMIAPFQMHCGPWEDQLDPVARRLLGESIRSRSRVSWEGLSELLSLVLRRRLLVTKRPLGLQFDDFGDPSPANETAKRIFNGLREGYTEDDIPLKHYVRLTDVLPDFHVQFQQLWADLLQPPMEVNVKPRKENDDETAESLYDS